VLLSLAACGAEPVALPTAPSTPVVAAPPPTPSPPRTGYPPIAGPGRIFNFRDSPWPRISAYTETSRFILYDNGSFTLQYASFSGEYRGTYTESNGNVVFTWEGWSAAGPWGAEARLDGDLLAVRYNLIMQLTDFEDANYVRAPN
jgi:hypothetical protein